MVLSVNSNGGISCLNRTHLIYIKLHNIIQLKCGFSEYHGTASALIGSITTQSLALSLPYTLPLFGLVTV